MLLALALVLIVGVDGSGSRWHIPRYQYVASLLNRAGLGMSLSIGSPPARRQARPTVFDIELLAGVAQSGDRAATRHWAIHLTAVRLTPYVRFLLSNVETSRGAERQGRSAGGRSTVAGRPRWTGGLGRLGLGFGSATRSW
jgi:hypothetical protein